jgi:REP element-mobilizing transposase RayT
LGQEFKEELTMPQSLSHILIHLIWSTKDRHPWLTPGIRERTHAFLAEAVRHMDCEAYRVGGVADHVHLAVRLSRTRLVADVAKEVKTASSRWVKTQDASLADFAWQQGYGVFSLGMTQKETLLRYIDTQEARHRLRTFQDEYRDFLTKNGIEYDERYVWD